MGQAHSARAQDFNGGDPLSFRFNLHVASLLEGYRYNSFDFGVDRNNFTDLLREGFSEKGLQKVLDRAKQGKREETEVDNKDTERSGGAANQHKQAAPFDDTHYWDSFDRKGSGLVFFLEVIAGAAVLAKDASLRDKAGFVFDLMDFDQKGGIDFDTAVVMLHTALLGTHSMLQAARQSNKLTGAADVPLASEEDCELIIEHALRNGANIRGGDDQRVVDIEMMQQQDLLWRGGWLNWVENQAQANTKLAGGGSKGKGKGKGKADEGVESNHILAVEDIFIPLLRAAMEATSEAEQHDLVTQISKTEEQASEGEKGEVGKETASSVTRESVTR